ncbi:MAG: hypothetical protein DRJ01_03440 [Bacteroidetes bacterium]|nr:MAG: hypothetical protein DRJ01_03440 [Bacteroidota bacterium]
MKRLLFIAFCFISINIFSQEIGKNMIGISIGVSSPINSFAQESCGDYSTCAKKGMLLSFDDVYFITKNIGITAVAQFSQNGSNADSIELHLTRRVTNLLSGIDNGFIFPDEDNYVLNLGTWTHANLMLGPVISIPIKSISFDFRALAGLSVISSPDKELRLEFMDGNFNSYEKIKNTPSFIYLFGTSVRYRFVSGYFLRFMVDWAYSKAIIEINDQIINTTQVQEMNIKSDYDVSTSILYAGVSFAYDF